jgi:DNA ligase (NAD+)
LLESASAVRLLIAQLREEIAGHDRAYHQDAAPEIADADYDELKRRLGELERQFPVDAQAVPPLPEIGDDRTGIFPTHRHRERMMSLGKVYAETELRAFHAKLVKRFGDVDLSYVVEPKYDGLAVSVTYEHGRLVRAVTRGNGIEGDDVTAHVRLLPGLPLVLVTPPPPAVLEARGEIFVPFAEFIRVNGALAAAGEAPFANPRNLAAGTLRQLDAREVVRRGLRVVF